MMNNDLALRITQQELMTLREFLKTVKDERDAIISFSLEGIIRENNKKEEILKKLEFLEAEKEKILKGMEEADPILKSQKWVSLQGEVEATMKEVRIALEKNMKLLSFSMDHVRGTIEKILGFINKATYGRKKERISVFLAREA